MKVIFVGIGMGNTGTMTMDCRRALESADVVLGNWRLLDTLPDTVPGERIGLFHPPDVLKWLEAHPDLERVCVAFSGDIGFYSGAKQLLALLDKKGYATDGINGISTPQYLCMRLGIAWQDIHLASAHGVDCDVLAHVLNHRQSFFLTGGKITPVTICEILTEAGLGDCSVSVGERLSYPDERITTAMASRLVECNFAPLSAVVVDRSRASFRWPSRSGGIPDDKFCRGEVPMTKQEVRSVILSKLAIRETDTVWDIGAGTGSVAVEAALAARWGRVYALERNPEACDLIRRNRDTFGVYNMLCVEGTAPGACGWLARPDAVFVGGSDGQVRAILEESLARNRSVRAVVSAITLETLYAAISALEGLGYTDIDTVQVSVSRSRAAGQSHMLLALNPIFIVSGRGPGE